MIRATAKTVRKTLTLRSLSLHRVIHRMAAPDRPRPTRKWPIMADWIDEETDNVRTTEKWTTGRK